MSANGNGKWIRSYWKRGGVRANNPSRPGWYAARPECCNMTVRVLVDNDLLDCYVEGNNNRYDVYDFSWWYPLKSQKDGLPEFRE